MEPVLELAMDISVHWVFICRFWGLLVWCQWSSV